MKRSKHILCQPCWHRVNPAYPYIIIAAEEGTCCLCGEEGNELVPERGPDDAYACKGNHRQPAAVVGVSHD